jgi:hypothetical protein
MEMLLFHQKKLQNKSASYLLINTVTSATHKLKKKKNDGGYLEEMENIF